MAAISNRDPKTGRFVSIGGSEVVRLRARVKELEAEVGSLRNRNAALTAELDAYRVEFRTLELECYRLKGRGFWSRVFNR